MDVIDDVVRIESGHAVLDADLRVPQRAAGLVIFAHGSGSGRFSPRNRAVACVLEAGGFATERPKVVRAVISRGGRPDLAGEVLEHVKAPTLLIVGGDDDVVIGLNQEAARRMRAPVELEIVPGATHLFEEPGALEKVARLATSWCQRYL